jgi:alanine racemase
MAFITINKKFLYDNLDYISSIVGGKIKICLGLKDNAYGHGIKEMASLIKDYGIKHVFVKDEREAQLIKHFCFDSVIVCYGKGIYQASSISHAITSLTCIENYSIGSIIELKIDTGMHRNGLLPSEIEEAIMIIQKKELVLKGVYTHFQSSDENNCFINDQQDVFNGCVNKIKKLINYDFRIHCSNSNGISKINNQNYDFARIGIAAYGYSSNYPEKLSPILSFYAEKLSTRVLYKGDRIGYGSSGFIVNEDDFTVSCYDVGYGDGFFRLDESRKYKLSNGKEVLGRVSMDCFSLEGKDESILLFDNAIQLSNIHNTIEYEILTALKAYITRIIV